MEPLAGWLSGSIRPANKIRERGHVLCTVANSAEQTDELVVLFFVAGTFVADATRTRFVVWKQH